MASIRKGIPHIYSTLTPKGNPTPALSDAEFYSLIKSGTLDIKTITEKTDGQNLHVGWDSYGFYTRHTGSGDMRARCGNDHIERARLRDNAFRPAMAFSNFHDDLRENDALQMFLETTFKLTGQDVVLQGEMFSYDLCSQDENGIKFANIHYDPNIIDRNTFIIHSQLFHIAGRNPSVELDLLLRNMSTEYIKIDHDLITIHNLQVDTQDLFPLIENHITEARYILHDNLVEVLENIKPKWGDKTEGYVFHTGNSEAPRFKLVSETFKKAKENGWQR